MVDTDMKKISILVPCYNEEKNIAPMARALTDIMRQYDGKYNYEIVFRDNASMDSSMEVLRSLASEDSHIKVISNARNYGASYRKDTFNRRVSGDARILIPCDFQEPPELIPEFIQWWERGYEAVCGQKISSQEGQIKYGLRSVFYKLIGAFSNHPQPRHMSGIVLVSKRIHELKWKSDNDESMRYFLTDIGCNIKLIPYEQQKRRSGKSSYNVWRYLSFAIESMISTSTAPLRIATVVGFLMSAISFVVGMFYLIVKLVWWYRFPAGTAPLLIGLFFLGSIQLLFIGIVGEYVGNILRKVTPNNPPLVKELLNFDNADEDPYLIRNASAEED